MRWLCHAEAVLTFFKRLQWDGAISSAMLHSVGIVLERCSDSVALDFVQSLTRAPALISPLQVPSLHFEGLIRNLTHFTV
jgi:hypothetical protein